MIQYRYLYYEINGNNTILVSVEIVHLQPMKSTGCNDSSHTWYLHNNIAYDLVIAYSLYV